MVGAKFSTTRRRSVDMRGLVQASEPSAGSSPPRIAGGHDIRQRPRIAPKRSENVVDHSLGRDSKPTRRLKKPVASLLRRAVARRRLQRSLRLADDRLRRARGGAAAVDHVRGARTPVRARRGHRKRTRPRPVRTRRSHGSAAATSASSSIPFEADAESLHVASQIVSANYRTSQSQSDVTISIAGTTLSPSRRYSSGLTSSPRSRKSASHRIVASDPIPPIGTAIDETRGKRAAIVAALAVLGIGGAVIFAWPSFWPVP
jgi:hypothetical protein